MDKLKSYLTILAKYQFWVLCGVILLTSTACWGWATKDLANRFLRRKSEIEDHFKKVALQPDPANEDVVKKINEQHEELIKGVYGAWEVLYKEEKEKNPLPEVLGPDFKRQFEMLAEKPKGDLARPYRELYMTYIQKYLPKLKDLIDVRRPKEEKEENAGGGEHAAGRIPPSGPRPGLGPAEGMGGRMPGVAGRSGGEETEWVGIVNWDDTDYSRLVEHFNWNKAPRRWPSCWPRRIFWVYEALLRVIRGANEGATSQANAAVKRIIALDIGRDAAAAWKEAETPVFTTKQGGPGVAPGGLGGLPGGPGGLGGPGGPGPGMGPGGPGMGSGGGKGGSPDAQTRQLPLRGRQGPAAARL